MDVEQLPYPWERQPGESDQAWEAFTIYRDMPLGEASHRQVAAQLGKAPQLMHRWSSRWEWVERRQTWEAEQDRRRAEAMSNEQVEMARRHATNAAAYMRSLLTPAEELIKRIRSNNGSLDLGGLSNRELVQLTVASARVFPQVMAAERIARGQSQGTQNLLRPTKGMDGAVITNEDQLKQVYAALEQAGLVPGAELPFDAGEA